jgi:hypothetical protein
MLIVGKREREGATQNHHHVKLCERKKLAKSIKRDTGREKHIEEKISLLTFFVSVLV